jgi:hypothetical protein
MRFSGVLYFLKMSGLREFLSGKPLKKDGFPSYNADIRKHTGVHKASGRKRHRQ